jgi:hypothetical protein
VHDTRTLAPGYYLGTWKHGDGHADLAIRVHEALIDEHGVEWITYETSLSPGQVHRSDFWMYPLFYAFDPCAEEDWLCAILAH